MFNDVLYHMSKEIKTRQNSHVKYDMGWQKRSFRRRYYFSSWHDFIIGGICKGTIDMFLYLKSYRKCDATDKRWEYSEEHECLNKFEGSSKSMEVSVTLNMVEDSFHDCFFIIDVIVSDGNKK